MRINVKSRNVVVGLVAALALATVPTSANSSARSTSSIGSLGSVYFSSGSSVLSPDAKSTLAGWSVSLKQASNVDVTGYVQKSGSSANDLSLSKARAESVVKFLRSIGVTSTFTVKGARTPKSKSSASTARRAEVVITKLVVKPTVKPTVKPSVKPTVKPSVSPSAQPAGSVSASVDAKTLNYIIGMQNATACASVTAKIILTPVGGGSNKVSNAVAGVGKAPKVINSLNLYYDCDFNVTFTGVTPGSYNVAIRLTGPNSSDLYGTDSSAWYTVDTTVSGQLTATLNSPITIQNGRTNSLAKITLDAAT